MCYTSVMATKKKIIRRPKAKRSTVLTAEEVNLLQFPPTEETWVCTNDHKQDGNVKPKTFFNHGEVKNCILCGMAKPRKPVLLYPRYITACAKVGIEPGLRWKINDDGQQVIRDKASAWRVFEPTASTE